MQRNLRLTIIKIINYHFCYIKHNKLFYLLRITQFHISVLELRSVLHRALTIVIKKLYNIHLKLLKHYFICSMPGIQYIQCSFEDQLFLFFNFF